MLRLRRWYVDLSHSLNFLKGAYIGGLYMGALQG